MGLRKGLESMTGRWMCAAVEPARVSAGQVRRLGALTQVGHGTMAVNLDRFEPTPLTSPSWSSSIRSDPFTPRPDHMPPTKPISELRFPAVFAEIEDGRCASEPDSIVGEVGIWRDRREARRRAISRAAMRARFCGSARIRAHDKTLRQEYHPLPLTSCTLFSSSSSSFVGGYLSETP
jgi:hypothetical protein